VGLAALEELLPSAKQERVKSLREKFARLYTNDIPVGAIHFTGDADKLKLKTITEAVAKDRKVAISYRNLISSNVTERELSVIKIVPKTNRTLIEAWCHNSNGIRTFNLANILKVSISDQGSEVKPDAKDQKESFRVRIELKRDGRFYSENQDQLVKEGDAYLIEIFQTEWLIRSALAEGGDMAIIEPRSIGVEVANRSKEALREYSRKS
jgi:proteasome accessory factor C